MIELAILVVILAVLAFILAYYKSHKEDQETTYSSHPYYPFENRPVYQEPETIYDPVNHSIRPRQYVSGTVRTSGLAIVDDDEDDTPPLVYIPVTTPYSSPNVNVAEPSTTGDYQIPTTLIQSERASDSYTLSTPQQVSDNLADTLERSSEVLSHGFQSGWSGGGSGDIGSSRGGSGGGSVGFDSGTARVEPTDSPTRFDTYPTSSTDNTPNVVSSDVSSPGNSSGFDSTPSGGFDSGPSSTVGSSN